MTVLASILHGAYGDYYEQAVCLKHYQLTHPDVRLRLFAASTHRLREFRFLDFSWAECFEPWSELPKYQVDGFFQFQVRDAELTSKVLMQLPAEVLSKLDVRRNRRPWEYLRSILPLTPNQQLGLSDLGRNALPDLMRQEGLNPDVFQRPTIGFLWRHRAAGGYIRPVLQNEPQQLVEKYSRLFRRLIDAYGCHVLVCGMRVPRTDENKHRIDAKFPAYGLDLPEESSTHLKGLSWPLELELLSRCTVCAGNSSGFTEALWIKRGSGVLLMDPPPHYLARALWNRAPFFSLTRPGSFLSAVASRGEHAAFDMIAKQLDRAWGNPSDRHVAALEDVAR